MKHVIPPYLENVPRETILRLENYFRLLKEWQKSINLVGDIEHAWERHFLDSAQLLDHLPDKNASIADLGSGAGFPGMVLAILGASDVHLIESDRKKITFLQEVARVTGTNISIHHSRIEQLPERTFDVITSRALAPLPELLTYSAPLMHADSFCLFPKGKNYSIELENARKSWRFELQKIPSQSGVEGKILVLRNVRRKGDMDG